MTKVINLSLTEKSIDHAIQEVKEYRKWIETKTQELVTELGKIGVDIASLKFEKAIVSGKNDVKCSLRNKGKNKVAVVATGKATLFIEFGTGVRWADDHPDKPAGLLGRGEYGKGKGKNPGGWDYVGTEEDQGTGGIFKHSARNGLNVYHTYGDPANKPMYETERELQEQFEDIARRVFQ